MVIKPMVRSNICLNAHPVGCRKNVEAQIAFVRAKTAERAREASCVNNESSALDASCIHNKPCAKDAACATDVSRAPKNVLVLGCSNGYGLASRIVASFGYGAATFGVSFEKSGSESKWGTPGWYNNRAFEHAASKANITAITVDGDAFSHAIKQKIIDEAKARNIRFDLVVYSLASPVRTDPDSGVLYKSVLKPIGSTFGGMTLDPFTGELKEISAESATPEEIEATKKVMGGEDWALWIEKLSQGGVLARGCVTVAYSYIGPAVSHAIYRSGTIGKAKEHLEQTAHELCAKMSAFGGAAYVSVNKGLVTRASAVIPIIPLYLSVLYKVMKEKGTHEDCIAQIERLFAERLYIGAAGGSGSNADKSGNADNGGRGDRCAKVPIPTDSQNRIRIDDYEMDEAVQSEVSRIMPLVTSGNSAELTDLRGYRHDFLATSGFDIEGVDYSAEIDSFAHI